MDRISGDFYQRFEFNWFGRRFVWRIYRESWIIDSPTVDWHDCYVDISGSVRYWKGTHPLTTADIRVPWSTFTSAGPATAAFTDTSGSETFTCPRKSSRFREVELEVDVADSVNVQPVLPDYDTHSHNNRPAGTDQRMMDTQIAYREAGINLTVNNATTVVDDSDPAFDRWSVAELHDAMEVSFSRYSGAWPSWKIWGFLAGRFDSLTTGGIMFDYSGAQEPPQRQGFAVFREHSWFNNLDAAPNTQAEHEAMRKFLYTWVHEAGHGFNYMHSWDKSRPDSLSWMNYDWKYDARNGPDEFWANFEFRFDDEELIHLRHGDRASVIMGGDDWASGGHLDAPGELHAEVIESLTDGIPLELLLRSERYFELMEPVWVELRLRNLLPNLAIPIDTRLQPEHGNVRIVIEKPNGSVHAYHAPTCQLGLATEMVLEPLAKEPGPDRFSERVFLSFGGTGFYFDQPGNYRIRAFYRGLGDGIIASNIASLRVSVPESREVDRLAQAYFDNKVGLALAFGGSRSGYLAGGMSVLQEMCSEFPKTDRAIKTSAVLARTQTTPFFHLDDNNKLVTASLGEQDYQDALALTEPGVEKYAQTTEKSHNFSDVELSEVRVNIHKQLGDIEAADRIRQDLLQRLQTRDVKPAVLKAIDEQLK